MHWADFLDNMAYIWHWHKKHQGKYPILVSIKIRLLFFMGAKAYICNNQFRPITIVTAAVGGRRRQLIHVTRHWEKVDISSKRRRHPYSLFVVLFILKKEFIKREKKKRKNTIKLETKEPGYVFFGFLFKILLVKLN